MARGPTAEEVDAAMLKRVPLALEPLSSHSFDSASIVVPIILQYVTPRSVIDFGCKHGEWLKIFKDHGATRIKGLDLERRLVNLAIDPSDFEAADLTRPIALDARYDLAVCIEVAEHLPAASAEPLVDTLVRAAPVVLFSAATPGQGGFEHVNERPRKYWASYSPAIDSSRLTACGLRSGRIRTSRTGTDKTCSSMLVRRRSLDPRSCAARQNARWPMISSWSTRIRSAGPLSQGSTRSPAGLFGN